jgi:uncharacterized protein (TIGR02453 family)
MLISGENNENSPMQVNLKPTLTFLQDLEKNNTKAWFDAHRAQYDAARAAFEEFVLAMIGEINKFHKIGAVSPKECIFRINRDVRFSRDKTPYKTNMGALIGPGGKKALSEGYYVHLQPHDQSFLAGGWHMPTSEQLKKFRAAIDRDSKPFKKIISSKEFENYFGPLRGPKLKLMPKGYPVDHPDIEILKLKEITAGRPITDKEVLSPNFIADASRTFKALKPFLKYLDAIA